MKKEHYLFYSNVAFACAILFSDLLYILFPHMAYVYKVIASAMFVLCALSNLLYIVVKKKNKNPANFILFVGLIFAMLGDILLIDYFLIGAIFFAIGHIFFLITFYFYQKFSIFDIVCSAVVLTFCLLLILLYKGFVWDGMKIIVIVYACVISLVLGKAISNFIVNHKNKLALISMIGAFLFFFSDLMLVFEIFTDISHALFSVLCLTTYYPAEFLLALSIALPKDKKQ